MDKRKNNQSLLIGVVGIALQVIGMVIGGNSSGPLAPTNPQFVRIMVAWVIILSGTAILIWGMSLYAQAKERSGWWGLFGLLGIIGLIVLSTLEDRDNIRKRSRKIQTDISLPPNPDSVGFLCFDCGYTLNGVVGTSCPECGRPFDPDDLSTVRFDNPDSMEKPPWTSRYSLMLGIISLVFFCIPVLDQIIAIVAIICGHCALYTIKHKRKHVGSGFAIAGLVTGYLGLVAGLILFGSILIGGW